jgi:hypothetical protein
MRKSAMFQSWRWWYWLAKNKPAKFSIQLNKNSSQPVKIPKGCDWGVIELKNINFNKEENKLRLVVEEGHFDLSSIEFDEAKLVFTK